MNTKRTMDYFSLKYVADRANGDHYLIEWQYAGESKENLSMPDSVTEAELQAALDKHHGKGALVVRKTAGSFPGVYPVEVTITPPMPAAIFSSYPFIVNAIPYTVDAAARIAELEKTLVESHALTDAVVAALHGEPVSDFEKSFLVVRMATPEGV
jgi:hypothetical protein